VECVIRSLDSEELLGLNLPIATIYFYSFWSGVEIFGEVEVCMNYHYDYRITIT